MNIGICQACGNDDASIALCSDCLGTHPENVTPEIAAALAGDSMTYCVGLPVIATVRRSANGDAHVTVEVDLSELGSRKALSEALDSAGREQDDERTALDADLLDIWTDTYTLQNEGWVTR